MKIYASMDQAMALRDVPAHAQRAERLGYSGLTVPEAVHDGMLTALLALEHTQELTVATSVVLAFPRSPTVLAYAAWDLQSLSGGRFELGLGTQVKGNIEGRYGVKWSPPIPRMREYMGALRAIWDCWQNGTSLDFEGEIYRLTRMQPFFDPGPIEHPGIPVFLGGINPAITRLAGETASGIMTHPTNSNPRYLRQVTRPALAEGARRSGRPADAPEILAGGFVATGPDKNSADRERERIREYLSFLYSTPQYWPTLDLYEWGEVGRRLHQLSREGRWQEMRGAISDEMLDRLVPSGTYAEISDILRDWYGSLATRLTFPMPTDPADDPQAREVILALGEPTRSGSR